MDRSGAALPPPLQVFSYDGGGAQANGHASAGSPPADAGSPSDGRPSSKKGRKKKAGKDGSLNPSEAASPEATTAAMMIDPALMLDTSGTASPAIATPGDGVVAPAAAATAVAAALDTTEQTRKDEEVLDVMTGAGIDLKAEQDAIGRAGPSSSGPRVAARPGADATMGGLFMNIYDLSFKVHRIAFKHQLQVDPDVLNYLSLATRQRFRNLLEACVATSRHRNWSHHLAEPGFYPDRKGKRRRQDAEGTVPLFHREVVSDYEAQLSAIERAERQQDVRAKQRRKEKDEKRQAQSGKGTEADTAEPAVGTSRGGVTDFKHASADVSKKLADSIANTAFGGGGSKYSWLSSGVGGLGLGKSKLSAEGASSASTLPKPRFQAAPPSTSTPAASGSAGWGAAASRLRTTTEGVDSTGGGGWGDLTTRQQQQAEEERLERTQVTLGDALQALERERAGGAGHGSGIATLYRTHAFGHPKGARRNL